ncbi:MAG: hypothetical protein WC574_06955 [Candidatus Omnitrophota bacterium]
MLQEYQKSMNILIGSGAPLFILGKFILPNFPSVPGILAPTAVLAGYFLLLFGCRALAKAKGYSGTMGLLVGLLSVLGLLILLLMKDKNK